MSLALGITLFAITGAIAIGYIVGCAMTLQKVEGYMKPKG